MLVMALLAVFIAGLMVGRTPEYLGKKIQAAEMKLVVLYIFAMPFALLTFAAASVLLDSAATFQPGAHGLSEVLYNFASAANNNGSAFAYQGTGTQWYTTTQGISMLIGRFFTDHPGAGDRRLAGRQAEGAGDGGHDADRHAAVRLPGRRRHRHRRRPHVLPRPRRWARSSNTSRCEDRVTATIIPDTRRAHRRCAPSEARRSIFDRSIVGRPSVDALRKLDPRTMYRNPVMFIVEIGAVLTTLIFVRDLGEQHRARRTCSPGWCRCGSGSRCCSPTSPRRWPKGGARRRPRRCARPAPRRSANVRLPDGSIVEKRVVRRCRSATSAWSTAGEVIPGDGDIVEGIATVDESAITGESAPVIRESGGDRSAVTGGTRVLCDEIVVRITAKPGETFLDRMIALVEGADRQKTPNEIALTILLAGLTIIFLLAVVTLQPFAIYSGAEQSVIVLVALLVCLIPTTIGGLLSAIGIAGMDRLVQRNVLAMSGRAVEAAGDVTTLLLDKTGTITYGSRQAAEFIPVHGVDRRELAEAALVSSLADETPEGRSIVELADRAVRPRAPVDDRGADAGAVHRPDPHVRHRLADGRAGPQGRRRLGAPIRRGRQRGRRRVPARAGPDRRTGVARRRHAARRDRQGRPDEPWRVLGVDPPEGHGEAGHARALRPAAGDGHPHGDDHRRQPADRGRDRRRRPASTTSSPRPRPRTRWR